MEYRRDLEAEDTSCLALEVKLSDTVTDRDARHLHWRKQQLGERVRDTVILNTGAYAYRRDDDIAVEPLALLKERALRERIRNRKSTRAAGEAPRRRAVL